VLMRQLTRELLTHFLRSLLRCTLLKAGPESGNVVAIVFAEEAADDAQQLLGCPKSRRPSPCGARKPRAQSTRFCFMEPEVADGFG